MVLTVTQHQGSKKPFSMVSHHVKNKNGARAVSRTFCYGFDPLSVVRRQWFVVVSVRFGSYDFLDCTYINFEKMFRKQQRTTDY